MIVNSPPWGLEWWAIVVGGVCTLAIFSFLWRENPFYRLFEHFYMGLATAIAFMSNVKSFVWPQVLVPLFGKDRPLLPSGVYAEAYTPITLLYLIPIFFGLLYYCILSERFRWLAQLVIGFSLGVGGGFAFKATINELFPQIEDTFRPLYVPNDQWASVNNIVFLSTLFFVFSYFFFTLRKRQSLEVSARKSVRIAISRVCLMACFGAFFGSTIMARMALLVDRLDFLAQRWAPALYAAYEEPQAQPSARPSEKLTKE